MILAFAPTAQCPSPEEFLHRPLFVITYSRSVIATPSFCFPSFPLTALSHLQRWRPIWQVYDQIMGWTAIKFWRYFLYIGIWGLSWRLGPPMLPGIPSLAIGRRPERALFESLVTNRQSLDLIIAIRHLLVSTGHGGRRLLIMAIIHITSE